MSLAMKQLQQMSQLNGSQLVVALGKSLDYRELNRPVSKLRMEGDIYRDYLGLGLFCFKQQPELMTKAIDYYQQSLAEETFIHEDWFELAIKEFEDVRDRGDKQILALTGRVFPVDELTAQIAGWFPLRQQTRRNTLWMLSYCGDWVGDAMDVVAAGEDLGQKTLEIISREHGYLDRYGLVD